MKNTLLISLVLIFTLSTSAQVSEKYKKSIKWFELDQTKHSTPTLLGSNFDNLFLIKALRNKNFIEKYDLGKFDLSNSKELIYRFRKKTTPFVDAFMIGNTPVLLTSFYNRKKKINYLFYSTINSKNLVVSSPKVLMQAKIKKGQTRTTLESFEFEGLTRTISDNKWLSMFSFPNPKKARSSKRYYNKFYQAKIFDGNFELTQDVSFEIPFEKFTIKKTVLGNDGTIFLLVDKLVSKKIAKSRKSKLFVEGRFVLFVDPETGLVETLKIDLENNEITKELILKHLKNGNIVVSGLISDEKQKGVIGSFSIIYNKEHEVISNETNYFTDNFIKSTWSEKRIKKEKNPKKRKRQRKPKAKEEPQFYNYYIDNIVELSDGSTVVFAEQYYSYSRTVTYSSSTGGSTVTTDYYYYNDIIAIKYDAKGKLEWEKIISKKQRSINDDGYYLSYFILEDKESDELSIIYNEGEVAVKVNLSADGELLKENIIEFNEEKKMRLVPKLCTELDGGVFLYAKGSKGSKFGVLSF